MPSQKFSTEKRRFTLSPKKGYATLLPVLCDSTENPMVPRAEGVYLIENPPFKIDTILFIGDLKDMKSYFKRKFNVTFDDVDVNFNAIDGVTIPCSRKDGSQFIMIYIPSFDWSASKFAVLAHEVVHSSVFILKMSGVHNSILEGDDDSDSDDECLAHLVDSQMEKLAKKMVCRAVRSVVKNARNRK